MSPLASQIIIWTFLVTFVLCVIGGLLVIFDRWVPKNPKVAKWLVNGVVISIVGTVIGFGTRQFAEPTPVATPAPIEAVKVPGPTPSPAPNTPTLTPTPSATPAPQPSPSPAASDVPEELRTWANEALGPRPTLTPIDAHPYPTCVADLRALAADDILEDDAKACGRSLDRYHANYVLPYYSVKAPYSDRLDRQEERLRGKISDAAIKPRYDYVVAEIARLNGTEWERVSTLDGQLRQDQTSCRKSRCQTPN